MSAARCPRCETIYDGRATVCAICDPHAPAAPASSQYREGHRDGVSDAERGVDATPEVQQGCRDEGGDPETCDYCVGYSDGQAEVPQRG